MANPRITARERGLLKGAINRVFSRSELRQAALATAVIEHTDPLRPRVKKWGRCHSCLQPTALYQMDIDHNEPRVPLDSSFESMSLDVYVDRTWCELNGLTPLCKLCHNLKSRLENSTRRKKKKEREKK